MTLLHSDARLVDAQTGAILGGTQLHGQVAAAAEAYARHPAGVVFAPMPTRFDAIVRLYGAFAAGYPIALFELGGPPLDLVRRFAPAIVLAPGERPPPEYRAAEDPVLGPLWLRTAAPAPDPHPDLALLLTTSGSTGNPKLVRLSRGSVAASAAAIVASLHLDGGEVAPTTLPLHYTYGLSVLLSHLHAGATVLLERAGLTSRDFWTALRTHDATSLAAVPYQYDILHRLRFAPDRYPRLRTLTQAGGRLADPLVADFHRRMSEVGGRLYVMYGQTEAGPRMTVLPPGRLPDKPGSVGLPVPGATITIEDEEVVFRSPAVMMGYAEQAADLARGDDHNGVLHTGDLGRLDDEGFLHLTGRRKRIAKVFGVRVSLDDVERLLAHHGPVAAVAGDDVVVVVVPGADDERAQKIRSELAAALGTHSAGIRVRTVDALPRTASGKVDYPALTP